jgi:asparagine synthase (glutamine-hydrolysing)
MCGINGVLLRKPKQEIKNTISEMNQAILHRGPDEDGVFVYEDRVAIGMRRLSIIDLSTGKQPIFNEDKSIVIVFNGEIYNYQSLRDTLIKTGVSFKTNSDTEVILKLYELHGKECLNFLNGMFAFAIVDKNQDKIFIGRDRLGEKPIYYYHDNNLFVWASELKSVMIALKSENIFPKISYEAISLYFSLSFIPAPYTIYDGVSKLKPGHWLDISLHSLDYTIGQYWDVKLEESNHDLITDYKVAQKQLRTILYDSIEKRMIADVPLGAFLSGGVDSSIITAVMADIKKNNSVKTFSISFADKNYDESYKAAIVAKHCNTDHQNFEVNYDEMRLNIDNIIQNFDEPFSDSSAIPTYYVSLMAREKVKVALTGDGGDEAFGGYERYLMGHYGNQYRKAVPQSIHEYLVKPLLSKINQVKENRYSKLSKIKKVVNAIGKNDFEDICNIISLCFSASEKEELLKSNFQFLTNNLLAPHIDNALKYPTSYLKKARYIDKNISLDGDMLVKVDRASMLASLECRAPFLDHRLFEFSNKLPDTFLIDKTNKKKILKETFSDLLPSNFLNLPKRGFAIPVGTWLRVNLKEEMYTLIDRDFLEQQNIFNIEYIQRVVNEHLNYSQDHTYKVWSIFCFQKWYQNNHVC